MPCFVMVLYNLSILPFRRTGISFALNSIPGRSSISSSETEATLIGFGSNSTVALKIFGSSIPLIFTKNSFLQILALVLRGL